jgi:transposase
MEHCAIDLGGRKSQVCVRSERGEILSEFVVSTSSLPETLRELPRCRVVLETAAETFRVADAALACGHEVRVVPSTLVRALGVGARRTKTDLRDARALSEASCRMDLPSVHIPSERSREWKAICGVHDVLIGSRTKMINNVRGWLRGQARRPRTGAAATFAERVRKLELQIPLHIEMELRMVDVISAEIKSSEKKLESMASQDPVCSRLMTVPGVGASTAVRFLAAIDEVSRFPNAHRVEAYLGLVPGENSSSERQQRLSITKAGSSTVRWALVQSAWVLRTCCRNAEAKSLQQWATEIEKRRGSCVATVALARKLAGILFALWRDGTTYKLR